MVAVLIEIVVCRLAQSIVQQIKLVSRMYPMNGRPAQPDRDRKKENPEKTGTRPGHSCE